MPPGTVRYQAGDPDAYGGTTGEFLKTARFWNRQEIPDRSEAVDATRDNTGLVIF